MKRAKTMSAKGDLKHVPREPRRNLLLIAADMEERRLLMAELLEAGYPVLALPGVGYAFRSLRLGLVAPLLVLVDVQGDEHAKPRDVERLLAAAPDVPLILVVGAVNSDQWESLRPRLAALLTRPISIGQIVEAVCTQITIPHAPREA